MPDLLTPNTVISQILNHIREDAISIYGNTHTFHGLGPKYLLRVIIHSTTLIKPQT